MSAQYELQGRSRRIRRRRATRRRCAQAGSCRFRGACAAIPNPAIPLLPESDLWGIIPSTLALIPGAYTNGSSLAAIALHARIRIGLREDLLDLPMLEAGAIILGYFLSSIEEEPCTGSSFGNICGFRYCCSAGFGRGAKPSSRVNIAMNSSPVMVSFFWR